MLAAPLLFLLHISTILIAKEDRGRPGGGRAGRGGGTHRITQEEILTPGIDKYLGDR